MRRWVPLFLGIIVAAVCVRLGVWQLHRLTERKAANRVLAQALADTVRVAGTFSDDSIVPNRGLDGVPGVFLYATLRTTRGPETVLRGFAPSPDARTVDLAALRERGPVTVTGVRLPVAGRTVLWRLTLPPAAPPHLVAVPPPPLGNGPHLGYAVQWFAFATIALVGGAILSRA